MKFGLARIVTGVAKFVGGLRAIDGRGNGGWWPIIREPYSGAWQNNDPLTVDEELESHAVYACITRISNAIGKLAVNLCAVDDNGIWSPTASAAFSPVLRRPNRFQNHIQFKQYWIAPKLARR